MANVIVTFVVSPCANLAAASRRRRRALRNLMAKRVTETATTRRFSTNDNELLFKTANELLSFDEQR